MNQSFYKICDRNNQAENIVAIIKPLTTLEIAQYLPTGNEYIRQITQLVQTITQLPISEFTIEEDINPITDEKDQTHVFVKLPSKLYVDKLYSAQPYFGCLIAHKLAHIQLCPFLRSTSEMCLMCTSKKVISYLFIFLFHFLI